MKQNQNQEIENYARQLRLPVFRKHYLDYAQQAVTDSQSHEQYLLRLMIEEEDERAERRRKQRVRRAKFPAQKLLQDLKMEELPPDGAAKLPLLERLDFIAQGRNVILSGNPGTGKTHIATGLGIRACLKGYTVLFTTVPRLITQILESRSDKTLRLLENRFEKYDLVICDEFGYISFDKQAAELLFTHLSLRVGRKATIITTNLGFDRWKEIFGDEVLTAAMVDRLTHKAIMVNMTGESFRVKESKMLANL
jgi:DNA replication protein DnaC